MRALWVRRGTRSGTTVTAESKRDLAQSQSECGREPTEQVPRGSAAEGQGPRGSSAAEREQGLEPCKFDTA